MRRGPEKGQGFGQGLGVSGKRARDNWGAEMPDWIAMLAREADAASQAAAGREIGYSDGVVSAVLGNAYGGDLKAVEKAVRGRFMSQTVVCPVLGEIGSHVCLEHQKRAKNFSGSSSIRVAIARACRGGCRHSRLGKLPPADGMEGR